MHLGSLHLESAQLISEQLGSLHLISMHPLSLQLGSVHLMISLVKFSFCFNLGYLRLGLTVRLLIKLGTTWSEDAVEILEVEDVDENKDSPEDELESSTEVFDVLSLVFFDFPTLTELSEEVDEEFEDLLSDKAEPS